MSHDVVSESMDVDVSSSINDATTAGSLAGHVSLTNSVIIRVTVFLTLAIFNLGGNGFTLITIRLTPRLWTKTNFILASMLVSNVITGVLTFWYAALSSLSMSLTSHVVTTWPWRLQRR